YNKKRDFNKTLEPKGIKKPLKDLSKIKDMEKKSKDALQLVVQHHIARRGHFDFRLEWKGVLLSWAVPKGPSYDSGDKRLAIQVENHPLEYRNFEGTIPKGEYGGGTVMLWDEGTWQPLNDVDEGLKKGVLKFALNGKRLMGKWSLIRLKDKEKTQNNWILIKEKDEYEKKLDISNFKTSIRTGRTMLQIANNEKTVKDPLKQIEKQLDKADYSKTIYIGEVKITSPNKIMFKDSDIKKIDIIKYYVKVAKRMLPLLTNRIVSLVRCPKGMFSACFFKKHPDIVSEGIVPIVITNKKNEKGEFFFIDNIYGVIFEAQMNTIEFHVWGSSVENLEYPDVMVFDLDPDEGMDLKQVRQGVKDLKRILDKLSLTSFLKTSGGKGYHVVVPFRPSVSWSKFYGFSKDIAKAMEKNWPDRYTSNIRKVNRKNKIFIDWERNGRGSTSVAPYSVRAKKGAPVSMPISWKELDTIAPQDFNIKNSIERLKKADPWKNFFKANRD
ncbi:MAG: non-homologous end-joining DNA ligase, partial [Clostridia bacterium]|nr:non-homologous end-joining DNA ligase [Clostridia bacterium]